MRLRPFLFVASPFAGITYLASSTETHMNTNHRSLDRGYLQGAALYPTRYAGRHRTEASTLHDPRRMFDAPLSLARIFHPYEYWAYATPDGNGDAPWASSHAEPEPPESGWPAAPPGSLFRWWRSWTLRGFLRSGAL
jgi:hypothetical protein